LPFEVLPMTEGQRLIDTHHISYLTAGRDVLRFGAASTGRPGPALVIADPDFDLTASKIAQPQLERSVTTTSVTPGNRVSRDMDLANLHFDQLPNTRAEGEHVATMLSVQPWLGGEALESRIKDYHSPRILHIATHGFFLADQVRIVDKEWQGPSIMDGQDAGTLGRLSGTGLENPMLRSGLALAGANTWLRGGSPPIEAEDGILTAEDVSGLDLLSTELVVLSACETGLGEIHAGEGVFGLRRSFVVAGAKTLVMSLWKVPEEETQELMEDFYRLVMKGQPVAEALREAQLAIRARYPDVVDWGAFICQGDPGSIGSEIRE
jgi:CHAT domain-containing protein